MTFARAFCAFLLACFAMLSPARAETIAERQALLAPNLTIVKPDGAGPFTTVILMHGCGGRRIMMDTYANAITRAGAAAIIADSLTPRGIDRFAATSTVCTGLQFRGRERAGDLYAMMSWARAQSWVAPNRIIAAGWSHGGWTIMDALSLRPGDEMERATHLTDLSEEPLAGLAAVFLCYPYVGTPAIAGRRPWRIHVDALAIVGGRDSIAGTQSPLRAFERLRARGQDVEAHLFPTATHAFDESTARDLRIKYDPELAAQSEALLQTLIARVTASRSG